MAKAELPLTPERLLAEIRAGSLKEEIIRTYRTTEADLAGMMSWLYRTGEIRKEEFNDFFMGVPLKKDFGPWSIPDAPAPEKEHDQAAARSRLSFSGLFSVRSRETAPERPDPSESETAESAPVDSHAEAASLVKVTKEISLQEAPEFKDSPQASIGGAEALSNASRPSDPDSEDQARPLLERILTRLDAIEIRLARIEEKLDAS